MQVSSYKQISTEKDLTCTAFVWIRAASWLLVSNGPFSKGDCSKDCCSKLKFQLLHDIGPRVSDEQCELQRWILIGGKASKKKASTTPRTFRASSRTLMPYLSHELMGSGAGQ
jgi:hypothetical protein